MLADDKASARRVIRAMMRAVDSQALSAASTAAALRLRAFPECANAEILLAFLSMPGEIDTAPLLDPLLAAGPIVAVPRIEGEDIRFARLEPEYRAWARDRFGIPEPPADAPILSLEELGRSRVVVVAPGLAFDQSGARLGRGKGYYDRFLTALNLARSSDGGSLIVVGYCLERQVLESVPLGLEDRRVDFVCTESRLFRSAADSRLRT